MIRKIYTSILIGLCMSIVACSDDNNGIDPSAAAPEIKFPIEELAVDLNQVDNLPVVAIIKSEAGLQSVTMKIQTSEGLIDYKTVTEFFNEYSYSLSESLEYNSNYQAVIIEATDKLNHEVSRTLPLSITDVMERPVITFDPEEIVYDEMEDNPTIPRTTFKVYAEAGLTKVEMYLVSTSGQELKASASIENEKEYYFDEMIEYKEGDKGFKVKAEDIYGNITISTMTVTYKTIPAPELTITDKTLFVDTDEQTSVPMHIESVRGIHEIYIYRIEDGQEVEAIHETRNGDNSLDYAPIVEFTNSTTQLKVVVSDGRENKNVTDYIRTYVNMDVATINVGSQQIANTAHTKYPDALGMVSLNDLTTYSVDYAIASESNAKNIDFKFYCFGGSAVPRLYSMDNTEKDSEFSGSTGKLSAIKVKNLTRFALLSNFDYENATVTSISTILSSSITVSKLTPIAAGDIIAFRTGGTSAAGGGRIGIMKVINITAAKELNANVANACVMTFEVKFPKKK